MNRPILAAAAATLLGTACSSTSAPSNAPVPEASTDLPIFVDAADEPETSYVPHPFLDAASLPVPCNGEPAFCERTYDALAYPTSHAAMAVGNPPFACPTQDQSLRSQLDHGIRAIDLEVHGPATADAGAGLSFCLGTCAAGQVPLGPGLADVRAFLDVNPREVVTLLVEGPVPAAALESALATAGLDSLAYAHTAGTAWPTLDAMIAMQQRVVVLADTTGTAPAWMLPLWSNVAETGRGFSSVTAFTCDVTRGPADAPLFLLNEILVAPVDAGAACASAALAGQANAEPAFLDRANACVAVRGGKPNFVAVDDYDDGDVFGVTQALDMP